MAVQATIDNWYLADLYRDGTHLVGNVSGHSRLSTPCYRLDMTVHTSPLVGRRQGKVVTMSETEYTLLSHAVGNKLQRDADVKYIEELEELE